MTRCSDLNCDSCNPGPPMDYEERFHELIVQLRNLDILMDAARDVTKPEQHRRDMLKQAATALDKILNEYD